MNKNQKCQQKILGEVFIHTFEYYWLKSDKLTNSIFIIKAKINTFLMS